MPVSVFTVNKELLVTSFILVLILYPLVNTRAAPVGVREGTAQMVTPHVFIVVTMDRNACTPCKASLSVRTLMLLINISSSVITSGVQYTLSTHFELRKNVVQKLSCDSSLLCPPPSPSTT